MTLRAFIIASWLLGMAAPLSLFAQTPASPAPAAATPDQIAKLVSQLDSDVFFEREMATVNLVKAGAAAVEPVADLLEEKSLEVTLRAIHILKSLAMCGDEQAETLAVERLERATQLRRPLTARRIELAIAGIGNERQARTIEILQRLGAKFSATTTPFGVQVDDEITEVEIGEEWRGEEKDLRHLRWLGSIHKVTFSGQRVTDGWLKAIAGFQNLTDLRIKRAKITDDGIAHIRNLPRLVILSLRYMPIGDASVDHLVNLKTLQKLEIYGTDVTPAGAERLRTEINEFVKLDFRRGGFLGIGGQEHFAGYQIYRVQENSAAAKAGIQVEDILIKFEETPIRTFEELTGRISKNRAGDTVTLTIARVSQPRSLELTADDIREELGLSVKPHALGLEVTEVKPKSTSALIGLRVGDVVARTRGAKIESLEQLQKSIAALKTLEFRIGSIELEYFRGAQVLDMKVTLGEWE